MPMVLVSPKINAGAVRAYEETVRNLTGGKTRLESPADWPVEGCLPTSRDRVRALSA